MVWQCGVRVDHMLCIQDVLSVCRVALRKCGQSCPVVHIHKLL